MYIYLLYNFSYPHMWQDSVYLVFRMFSFLVADVEIHLQQLYYNKLFTFKHNNLQKNY